MRLRRPQTLTARLLPMITGKSIRLALLAVAVLVSGAIIATAGTAKVNNDPAAGLPTSSQSAHVAAIKAAGTA
ncbi:MAG: hypothetical protein ACLP52_18100 [Streptosporangiaceae bacterium]